MRINEGYEGVAMTDPMLVVAMVLVLVAKRVFG